MRNSLRLRPSKCGVAVFVFALACAPVVSHAQLRNWGRPADRDIASVHVAVQSIAPFEDYIAALQPTFKLTAEEARTKAIAQTQTRRTDTLRAFSAALEAVQRGGSIRPPEGETALGDVPDAAERAATPLTLPAGAPQDETVLGYGGGTSVFQFVAQLNTYVRDAAVRTRTRPYIVRLQISVLPTSHARGYDAYSTVSFFTEEGNARDGKFAATRWARDVRERLPKDRDDIEAAKLTYDQAKREFEVAQRTYHASPNKETLAALENCRVELLNAAGLVTATTRQLEVDTADEIRVATAEKLPCDSEPLHVIPLLFTDNFEASLHEDSLQRIRELSAALGTQGLGGRRFFGFRSQADDMERTLARNLNSLMTVTQVSENSLQIRLGAQYGNRTEAMIPRTYSVIALLLFPTAEHDFPDAPPDSVVSQVIPCSVASFTADTYFRHGRSGKLVRPSTNEDLVYVVKSLTRSWDEAERWLAAVQDDDFPRFRRLIGDATRATALWSRLVANVGMSSSSRGRFQAPFREITFFGSRSKGSVIDDGKTAQLTLNGGQNLVPDRIAGTLAVHLIPNASEPPKVLYVNSTAVEVTQDGRTATLTFPSLHGLVKSSNIQQVFSTVRYETGVRDWQTNREDLQQEWTLQDETLQPIPTPYVGPLEEPKKEEAPKPKKAFTLATTTPYMFVRRNAGPLRMVLKYDVSTATFPIFFSVENAQVANVTPEAKMKGVHRFVEKEGEYKLDLEGVKLGSTVTITAWRIDETDGKTEIKVDPVTVEVREQQ